MLLAVANRRFSKKILNEVMITTTKLTCMVFIILVGAQSFGLVFRGLHGDSLLREFIKHIPYGKWGVLAIVMGLIFIIGFFLDFIEITFIVIPVLATHHASPGIRPLVVLGAVRRQPSDVPL